MNQNTGGHFKLMSHVVRLSSFHANEGCSELHEILSWTPSSY